MSSYDELIAHRMSEAEIAAAFNVETLTSAVEQEIA